MVLLCAVACCNSSSRNPDAGVAFHSFPNKNLPLTKVWVTKCKRENAVNPGKEKICSLHFTEEDYHRDLRGELMGIPTPKHLRLKANAVPSQNLCPIRLSQVNKFGKQPFRGSSARKKRQICRQRREKWYGCRMPLESEKKVEVMGA